MKAEQLTLFIAAMRLGGIRSVLHADAIAETPHHLRPAAFAQALAAGKSTNMARLISAADLSKKIAEMAKERN